MRKPLGRLAAVVLAGALITFVAAPAAIAQETGPAATPSSATDTTSETTSSQASTTSSGATESQTSAPATDESSSTTSAPAATSSTSAETTESSKPTETSGSQTDAPTFPPEKYVDDTAYGFDLGNGTVFVTIACAGGQPTGFASPQFDVTDGPYQEEQDGRYWDYLVQLHEGVSFADNIQATWECPKAGGGSAPGGGAIAPGAGSSDTGAWQAGNGGKAQVAFAPKAGVETGFGGTARF